MSLSRPRRYSERIDVLPVVSWWKGMISSNPYAVAFRLLFRVPVPAVPTSMTCRRRLARRSMRKVRRTVSTVGTVSCEKAVSPGPPPMARGTYLGTRWAQGRKARACVSK